MSNDEQIEALASAASELSANPRDLDAWWAIAELLAELGDAKSSIAAFADLGRSASDLAAVALGVACVLKIREAGDEKQAELLLERIGKIHCKGSKRVDQAQSSTPPSPPMSAAGSSERVVEGEAGDAAKASRAAADRAMKEAAKQARARAPKVVPPTPLVRYLSASEFKTLVSLMSSKRYHRGDVVVDVGDDADALYWIARGSAEVSKGDKLLGELRSDAFFGEIALVGATTRTARVACLEETDLLVIPESAVGEMAVKAPSLAKVLASHARSRLLSNVMRTSELFRRLSAEEKRSLLPRFESSFADPDELVIESGKANQYLFVLVSGTCEVRDGQSCITALGVGDGFGEMSMLGRKEATFDVVATSPVVLLRVSRDMFDEIAMAHPELLAEVYKLLVARERENSVAIIHDAEDLVI